MERVTRHSENGLHSGVAKDSSRETPLTSVLGHPCGPGRREVPIGRLKNGAAGRREHRAFPGQVDDCASV